MNNKISKRRAPSLARWKAASEKEPSSRLPLQTITLPFLYIQESYDNWINRLLSKKIVSLSISSFFIGCETSLLNLCRYWPAKRVPVHHQYFCKHTWQGYPYLGRKDFEPHLPSWNHDHFIGEIIPANQLFTRRNSKKVQAIVLGTTHRTVKGTLALQAMGAYHTQLVPKIA